MVVLFFLLLELCIAAEIELKLCNSMDNDKLKFILVELFSRHCFCIYALVIFSSASIIFQFSRNDKLCSSLMHFIAVCYF